MRAGRRRPGQCRAPARQSATPPPCRAHGRRCRSPGCHQCHCRSCPRQAGRRSPQVRDTGLHPAVQYPYRDPGAFGQRPYLLLDRPVREPPLICPRLWRRHLPRGLRRPPCGVPGPGRRRLPRPAAGRAGCPPRSRLRRHRHRPACPVSAEHRVRRQLARHPPGHYRPGHRQLGRRCRTAAHNRRAKRSQTAGPSLAVGPVNDAGHRPPRGSWDTRSADRCMTAAISRPLRPASRSLRAVARDWAVAARCPSPACSIENRCQTAAAADRGR